MKGGRIFCFCLFLAIGAFVAGCSGTATPGELRAREDIKAAESSYHHAGQKAELPALTGESSLKEIIEYALLNNPKVESAFYDWKAAVESITVERSLPDPMLNLKVEIMRAIDTLTPSLMTEIPGPGKIALRAEATTAEAAKKRALFENELLTTALNVKRVYYQMWVLEEEIRLMKETLSLLDELERVARERLAVGKVTQQDVLRAQIERDKLKTQLSNLEDSRKTLKARIRAVLGLKIDQDLPAIVAHLEPTKPEVTEESLLETAFLKNPRIKVMQSEVKQAIALYQLASKSGVPDFSGELGVNLLANPLSWMGAFGVRLPVWRDKIAAEIARGSAELESARAKLAAEELDIAVMFAETVFAWREADRNAKLYGEKIIPKAQEALQSALSGYVSGVSDFMDLLEAERSLLEYRTAQAVALGQREMVLAEMSFAILGRWPEGVKEILAPEKESVPTSSQEGKEK